MAAPQSSGPLAAVLGGIRSISFGQKSKNAPVQGSSSLSAATMSSRARDWEEIPNADAVLLDELRGMFWAGVRRELTQVIRTLKAWSGPELNDVELDGECDADIGGFETFLDQVSASSRDFAVQYGRPSFRPYASSVWFANGTHSQGKVSTDDQDGEGRVPPVRGHTAEHCAQGLCQRAEPCSQEGH